MPFASIVTAMTATLAFLQRNGAGLEAICLRAGCGEVGTVDIGRLIARYGDQVTIEQLEPRLVCRRCGQQSIRLEPAALRHGPIR
jgi:hypothetical protein